MHRLIAKDQCNAERIFPYRRAARSGIEAPVFPEWFACDTADGDTPGRRRLVRFGDLKPPARKEHEADDGKKRRTSPVRFSLAPVS